MLAAFLPSLWAVHIADGVLSGPWVIGGCALAGLVCRSQTWTRVN